MKKLLYSLTLLIAALSANAQTPAIIFSTTSPIGSTFSFGIDASYENTIIQVDWGNGLLTDYTITYNGSVVSGTLAGNTIKVYGSYIYNLALSGKNLTLLDVSAVPELRYFNCSKNQLTALDVSMNSAITDLTCNDNQLTALDVSKNFGLQFLTCNNNQLTTLDLSKNRELLVLICDKNKLTSIDVSNSIFLGLLFCSGNQLNTLDVSKNTTLTGLSCWRNQLSVLDVSKNTALSTLYCSQNALATLDVSANTALTELQCSHNKLIRLDVSLNTALTMLDCSDNTLATLDPSKAIELARLYCGYNKLTSLDVSKNPALSVLFCLKNKLTFSTLPIHKYTWSTYSYSPQSLVVISKKQYEVSEQVDLSNQLSVNGNTTTYAWKTTGGAVLNVGIDYSVNNGVFTFVKAQTDSIYCQMTNATFPLLVLETEKVKIVSAPTSVDETFMKVNVYPNPIKESLNIEFSEKITRVEFYTIVGVKVIDLNGNNTNTITLSADILPKGMLILKVHGGNTVMETKILNQ